MLMGSVIRSPDVIGVLRLVIVSRVYPEFMRQSVPRGDISMSGVSFGGRI